MALLMETAVAEQFSRDKHRKRFHIARGGSWKSREANPMFNWITDWILKPDFIF